MTEGNEKTDWSAIIFVVIALPIAFTFGGVWVGIGVFIIGAVALGWSKRNEGPFPTNQKAKASAQFKQVKMEMAEQGEAQTQYNLGLMYYEGQGVTQDFKQSFSLFTKAAEQGYAEAQHMLGYMYYMGEGVKRDNKQAIHWYTKAADQGYVVSQIRLGDTYHFGYGVAVDYKQAFNWYTKAAEQGDANGQFFLGFMYDLGQGIPQDYKQAYIWHSIAASNGVSDSEKERDKAAAKLTPATLNIAQQEAAALAKKIENNLIK